MKNLEGRDCGDRGEKDWRKEREMGRKARGVRTEIRLRLQSRGFDEMHASDSKPRIKLKDSRTRD